MAGLKMATILDNGEMALSDEECEKLKMPPNTVVVSMQCVLCSRHLFGCTCSRRHGGEARNSDVDLDRQPVDNVEQFKGMLQEIDDEAIRRLARQIGTNPAEEPYPGDMPTQQAMCRSQYARVTART